MHSAQLKGDCTERGLAPLSTKSLGLEDKKPDKKTCSSGFLALLLMVLAEREKMREKDR